MQPTLVNEKETRKRTARKFSREPMNFSILGFWGFRICQICGKKPIVNSLNRQKRLAKGSLY